MSTKIYFRHSEFRKGQDTIISDILTALNKGNTTLLHAPTGTGKTDAALSAAITFAKENNMKVLFLTPKIAQHKIALEVIDGINKKYNTDLKAIDFVGKRNLCIDPGISQVTSGFYEVCRHAVKKKQCPFYLNIKPTTKSEKELLNYKLEKGFQGKFTLSHQDIKELAMDFKDVSEKPLPVCAYELSKVFAKKCNVIIADYYHVFSEKIAESLLADIGIDLNRCVVVVDEAHNLEDRVLKLLSKSLNTQHLNRAIKEAGDMKNSKLKSVLKDILRNIEELSERKFKKGKNVFGKESIQKYGNEEYIKKEDIIPPKYQDYILEIIKEIEETGTNYIEKTEEHRSALIAIALFLDYWVKEMPAHIRYIKFDNNLISIKYNALDVSLITKDTFNSCYASIIMSATLTPLKMYQNIFGLDKYTVLKEYSSPFNKENRLDLLVPDVTTKYTKRNGEEYRKIANYVNKIVNSVPGNIVIFFPSFEILRQVTSYVNISKPKIIQEENSTSEEFSNMINEFKSGSRTFGAALFAVMGGKASEGIDLPGNYLISAVIVGVPLAKMELNINAKIEYYEKKYNKGWQYAYIQPAIQKTIQSAGRVIRSTDDRGVIVYLDGRYGWDTYRRHLPISLRLKSTKTPDKEIAYFFK